MFVRTFLIFLLLSKLIPSVLLAQMQTFSVEAAKSEIHFGLGDPLHAIHGTFRIESGTFTFEPKGGDMGGKITVDATSGASGNASRDRKMTEEELKASSFSTVTFSPKRYTGILAASGNSTITVEGVFTLLGMPHDISVPMEVKLEGPHCTATGSFQLPYVKWGLKDPSVFVLRVGKEVKVDLTLVGSVSGR